MTDNDNIEIEENNEALEMEEAQDSPEDKESRYTDGQELTFVNVRFPGNSRSFPFLLGTKRFYYGQKVVAMSDRGMTVGYVNSFPYNKPFDKSMLPLRTISKVATEEDLQKERDHISEEKRAERICVDLIERHKLDMNLTHVEFTQFGKKAVFFFTAPNRIDFRNLVKDLVTQLKMRIELRQISVRDRSAALGAIGPCGLQTCCSSFHKNYGNVTIKMAKNQNLALMPNKINGVCGQIKCCIKYEHELYAEKRKLLPKENSLILAKNGDKGKVLKLNLLEEEFELITSEGKIRRYTASEFDERRKLPEDWRMPDQFENGIVNETKELIGAKVKEETPLSLESQDAPKEEMGEDNQSTPAESVQENAPVETAAPQAQQERRHDNRPQGQRRHHHHGNRKGPGGGKPHHQRGPHPQHNKPRQDTNKKDPS